MDSLGGAAGRHFKILSDRMTISTRPNNQSELLAKGLKPNEVLKHLADKSFHPELKPGEQKILESDSRHKNF